MCIQDNLKMVSIEWRNPPFCTSLFGRKKHISDICFFFKSCSINGRVGVARLISHDLKTSQKITVTPKFIFESNLLIKNTIFKDSNIYKKIPVHFNFTQVHMKQQQELHFISLFLKA